MYKKTVYCNNDGEIVKETDRQYVGVFDEDKGYLFWNQRNFVKAFSDVDYPAEMNDMEIGRMARLSKKVWSNTNMLGYRGDGSVKPYDIKGMGQVVGIQERQSKRFIGKMIRLGVMAKNDIETNGQKSTQYYLNPIYFFSSNRIPLNLYLIFQKQLDDVLPEWVKESYNMQKQKEKEMV